MTAVTMQMMGYKKT